MYLNTILNPPSLPTCHSSRSLDAAPYYYCFDEKWRSQLWLGIFGLLFYVIGIPLGMFASLLYFRVKYGEKKMHESSFALYFIKKVSGRVAARWGGDVFGGIHACARCC